ncbi:uncharacterized protein [Euphorbia lathyris]|uniref:uncharacterized protein isoform X4 n=1 Tax=Euphorbia lathyris TaxID=212925 RepID=UPI003313D33E
MIYRKVCKLFGTATSLCDFGMHFTAREGCITALFGSAFSETKCEKLWNQYLQLPHSPVETFPNRFYFSDIVLKRKYKHEIFVHIYHNASYIALHIMTYKKNRRLLT